MKSLYSLQCRAQAPYGIGGQLNQDQSVIQFKVEALRNIKEIDELEKGISLYNSGSYDEALECLKKSLEANSNNARTLYYKGLTFTKLSKYEDAISCLNDALEIDPKYDEAQKAKEQVVEEQRQKQISSYTDEGLRYSRNNDYQNAIDSFDKAINLDPRNYLPYYEKGNVQLKLEEYDQALEYYGKALEIKPDYYYAWYGKGQVFYSLEKYKEAIGCFDEALKMQPSYDVALKAKNVAFKKQNEKEISLILNEGIKNIEKKDYENAITLFDKAIATDPESHIAHSLKGSIYFKLEDYKKALECYDKAMKINPKYVDVLKDKGLALYRLKKYNQALETFDVALKIKPDNSTIQN